MSIIIHASICSPLTGILEGKRRRGIVFKSRSVYSTCFLFAYVLLITSLLTAVGPPARVTSPGDSPILLLPADMYSGHDMEGHRCCPKLHVLAKSWMQNLVIWLPSHLPNPRAGLRSVLGLTYIPKERKKASEKQRLPPAAAWTDRLPFPHSRCLNLGDFY